MRLHSPRFCCNESELRDDGRGSCGFAGLLDIRPETCLRGDGGSGAGRGGGWGCAAVAMRCSALFGLELDFGSDVKIEA